MRRHKYNATKVTIDGHTFDSKKEAKRYGELKLLEMAGEISNLELQPKFDKFSINGEILRYPNKKNGALGSPVTYTADFRYVETGKGVVVEDVKGMDTQVSRIKRGLVKAVFKVEVVTL